MNKDWEIKRRTNKSICNDRNSSDAHCVTYSNFVYPSLYLKSNINIISGNGSKSNPYKLN